ncbi:MAG TPA: hypothetical protein VL020_05160 [Pseudomonadales bacterium]|nr:hypothetical protein [Pseudomonadales bacterium]
MKIKNVLLSTFLAATMCSPAYAVMTETQEQRLRHGVLVTKGCNALNEYAASTYDLASIGYSEADIINLTNFAKGEGLAYTQIKIIELASKDVLSKQEMLEVVETYCRGNFNVIFGIEE